MHTTTTTPSHQLFLLSSSYIEKALPVLRKSNPNVSPSIPLIRQVVHKSTTSTPYCFGGRHRHLTVSIDYSTQQRRQRQQQQQQQSIRTTGTTSSAVTVPKSFCHVADKDRLTDITIVKIPALNSIVYSSHHLQNMSTATSSTTTTTKNAISNENDCSSSTLIEVDIEELHERSCEQGEMSYIDPTTGFTCFTKLAHLKRGVCCGNYCRHCPYNWKNAKAAKKNDSKNDNNNNDDDSSSSSGSNSDESDQSEVVDQPSQSRPLHMNDVSASTTNNVSKTGGKYGGTYTKKNVVYTRGGDTGTSQLLNGERRMKSDIVFEALGTVDELCSIVGVSYAELIAAETTLDSSNSYKKKELERVEVWLLEIMSRLFDIGSHVAKPRKHDKEFIADGVGNGFDSIHIQELEVWIDTMTEALPELTSFVLPTGSRTSAQLHVARTVCRRTERTIVPLVVNQHDSTQDSMNTTTTTPTAGCDPNALAYINRLSDFFFTAARYVNDRLGVPDIAYQRPTRSSKQRTRIVLKSSDTT